MRFTNVFVFYDQELDAWGNPVGWYRFDLMDKEPLSFRPTEIAAFMSLYNRALLLRKLRKYGRST